MKNNISSVAVSENFKKTTQKAIFAIILFIIVYLVLLTFSIVGTCISVYLAISLVVSIPNTATIICGIGIVIMCFLILLFLIKFAFKRHTFDRSEYIEITKVDEPELFELIREIVDKVGTHFPKRVYLSANVGAFVFYDSSFWSMFFPIKKNLAIGIGLVNSVTKDEFKAILSHEFGHFSQKTMKIGSYAYNLNHIIYNILEDNDSYNDIIGKLGGIHTIINLFILVAIKIVKGIQWILRKLYNIVNLSYMGLSREMEFNADEIAATITGSEPLVTSLLRLDLAEKSYHSIIDFYSNKVEHSEKTKNIYPQHHFVMQYSASLDDLPIEYNLPQINLENLNKYDKSKLVIKDQWASHPRIEDRVEALNRLNIVIGDRNYAPATNYFKNINKIQEQLTAKLFENVLYIGTVKDIDTEAFITEFKAKTIENSYPSFFNNYYSDKSPTEINLDRLQSQELSQKLTVQALFNDDIVNVVYNMIALKQDILVLKQIGIGDLEISTFDYDGIKYTSSNVANLISKLSKELAEAENKIKENDQNIYAFYFYQASKKGKEKELKEKYFDAIKVDRLYQPKKELYLEMRQATNFIYETMPSEIIQEKMLELEPIEVRFKKDITNLLDDKLFKAEIIPDYSVKLKKYLEYQHLYFVETMYDEKETQCLIDVMDIYRVVITQSMYKRKKELLLLFEELN